MRNRHRALVGLFAFSLVAGAVIPTAASATADSTAPVGVSLPACPVNFETITVHCTFTAERDGALTIVASGASGKQSSGVLIPKLEELGLRSPGGKGAKITGTVLVKKGDVLEIGFAGPSHTGNAEGNSGAAGVQSMSGSLGQKMLIVAGGGGTGGLIQPVRGSYLPGEWTSEPDARPGAGGAAGIDLIANGPGAEWLRAEGQAGTNVTGYAYHYESNGNVGYDPYHPAGGKPRSATVASLGDLIAQSTAGPERLDAVGGFGAGPGGYADWDGVWIVTSRDVMRHVDMSGGGAGGGSQVSNTAPWMSKPVAELVTANSPSAALGWVPQCRAGILYDQDGCTLSASQGRALVTVAGAAGKSYPSSPMTDQSPGLGAVVTAIVPSASGSLIWLHTSGDETSAAATATEFDLSTSAFRSHLVIAGGGGGEGGWGYLTRTDTQMLISGGSGGDASLPQPPGNPIRPAGSGGTSLEAVIWNEPGESWWRMMAYSGQAEGGRDAFVIAGIRTAPEPTAPQDHCPRGGRGGDGATAGSPGVPGVNRYQVTESLKEDGKRGRGEVPDQCTSGGGGGGGGSYVDSHVAIQRAVYSSPSGRAFVRVDRFLDAPLPACDFATEGAPSAVRGDCTYTVPSYASVVRVQAAGSPGKDASAASGGLGTSVTADFTPMAGRAVAPGSLLTLGFGKVGSGWRAGVDAFVRSGSTYLLDAGGGGSLGTKASGRAAAGADGKGGKAGAGAQPGASGGDGFNAYGGHGTAVCGAGGMGWGGGAAGSWPTAGTCQSGGNGGTYVNASLARPGYVVTPESESGTAYVSIQTNPSGVQSPTLGAVAPGSGEYAYDRLVATWQPPADDGNSELMPYLVRIKEHGTTGPWITYTSADTRATLTGLVRGQAYDVQIASINEVGTGPWSGDLTYTVPDPTPPAPLTPVSDSSGTCALTAPTGVSALDSPPYYYVTWTASSGGAITGYVIQQSLNGTTWTNSTIGMMPQPEGYEVGPFTTGTYNYYFRVAAVGSCQSEWSAASAMATLTVT